MRTVDLRFWRDDDLAGFVTYNATERGVAYWAYLFEPGHGPVALHDDDIDPPRVPRSREIRSDGLWADTICETPGVHWSFGLEAFALRLDDPRDGWGVEIGERLPFGLDLEWERDPLVSGSPGEAASVGSVSGEILVDKERIDFAGKGLLRLTDDAPAVGLTLDVVSGTSPSTLRGTDLSVLYSRGLPAAVTLPGHETPVPVGATAAIHAGGGAGTQREDRISRSFLRLGAETVAWLDVRNSDPEVRAG